MTVVAHLGTGPCRWCEGIGIAVPGDIAHRHTSNAPEPGPQAPPATGLPTERIEHRDALALVGHEAITVINNTALIPESLRFDGNVVIAETRAVVFTKSDHPARLTAVWETLKITWESGPVDELSWCVVGYELREVGEEDRP